jgi:hypothetical protein
VHARAGLQDPLHTTELCLETTSAVCGSGGRATVWCSKELEPEVWRVRLWWRSMAGGWLLQLALLCTEQASCSPEWRRARGKGEAYSIEDSYGFPGASTRLVLSGICCRSPRIHFPKRHCRLGIGVSGGDGLTWQMLSSDDSGGDDEVQSTPCSQTNVQKPYPGMMFDTPSVSKYKMFKLCEANVSRHLLVCIFE